MRVARPALPALPAVRGKATVTHGVRQALPALRTSMTSLAARQALPALRGTSKRVARPKLPTLGRRRGRRVRLRPKLSTLFPLAVSLALGYVLGAAAGRRRFEQLEHGAASLLQHPKVKQTMFDLADQVEANAERLPGVAGDLADGAAMRLQDTLTKPSDDEA